MPHRPAVSVEVVGDRMMSIGDARIDVRKRFRMQQHTNPGENGTKPHSNGH
jgi:hypothetical protein